MEIEDVLTQRNVEMKNSISFVFISGSPKQLQQQRQQIDGSE